MTKTDYLKELENRIGYRFQDIGLLEMSMRHSSYTNEHKMSRLQYNMYPDKPEGELTKMRASLVCEPTLAYDAREIDLGNFLLLGKGEETTGGRSRNSVTSDAIESVIGAIFLDGGFANAKEFIRNYIFSDIDNKKLFYDSKTILQEIIQSNYKEPLNYNLLNEEGPDHNKKFTVEVEIEGNILAKGTGRTKKAAEQEAAYKAILKIKNKI